MSVWTPWSWDTWTFAPSWAIALRDEIRKIGDFKKELDTMAQTLDDLLADVADESTQIDSLATLTTGLKDQLDAVLAGSLTPEQQAKVDAIFAAVDANKQKVVDSINKNTPAAPTT